MEIKTIAGIVLFAFILGWIVNSISISASELPFSALTDGDSLPERASPKDRLSEDNIHVLSNRIIIDLANAQWSKFTDTNSMDPVLDAGANALQVVPASPEDISIGDIVSYESSSGTIIHRVIATGNDEEGWYAIMKGDNNPSQDPYKVRFSQVKRVVVGILY